MELEISRRGQAIQPSPTIAVDTRAKELVREGIDVIGFGAGQPDFPTPAHIKQAAVDAIAADKTGYTPAAGIPQLKEAICAKFERENGLAYTPEQIVVSVGAKHSLFNVFMVLLNEADEVLLPAPYWVTYPEQIRIAGGIPVILPTEPETGFKVTPDQVREAIGRRTRLLVLNSPNNPTGAVYSADELRALGQVLLEHGVGVVTDEVYEKLVFGDEEHHSIVQLVPELKPLSVVVNAVSKAYSMTGWRIGYAGAPREVAAAMGRLQGQTTTNPTSISQWAALAALEGGDDAVRAMAAEYERRRDRIVNRLNELPGLDCPRPGGAFYAFPSIEGLIGRSFGDYTIEGSDDLARYLLEEARVAVVPGSGFGFDTGIRLSYALAFERMEEGLDRIAAALS